MQTKVIERIRNEIDVVKIVAQYLNLTKKGNNFLAICPFHEDSRPSLTISPTKQIFKCFACGAGGDVITFVSDYEKISFWQAVKNLAATIGIDVVSNQSVATYTENELQMLDLLKDANDFFMNALMTIDGQKALEYTKKRNLSLALIEKFNIGFSDEKNLWDYLKNKSYDEANAISAALITKSKEAFFKNRLTFAIKNEHGDIVGFSARALHAEDQPKYLNSSDNSLFNKSKLLYNFFNAKNSIEKSGEIIIVEGFMDVIALAKADINNAVALMGTNLSSHHLQMLKNYKVILMLDNDKAGITATLQAIKLLVKNNIRVQIINHQLEKDADQIFNSGQEKLLKTVIQQKNSWIEFAYKNLLPTQALESTLPIENFINEFKNYLLMTNELEWEFYINKISKHFNISKNAIISLMPKRMNFLKKTENLEMSEHLLENVKIKQKNYPEIIIRSMLKNPQLIKIFKNNNLSFDDEKLILVSKFLTSYEQNLKMPLEIKQKCLEILNNDSQIANSASEFQDYIDRIKWINKQNAHQKIIASIKNMRNPNIAIKLLEEQIKLKKGKQ